MRARSTARAALLTAFLSLAAAPSAGADPPAGASDVADALFWEGRRAAEAGDFDTACDKFARSLALERLPGTMLNLASCEESRGRIASAWRHYSDATARMAADDRRQALASERASALLPRLPRLSIRVDEPHPPGLRVTCDGEPIETGSLATARPLDPGKHRIRVTADGRARREVEVVLVESQVAEARVEVGSALPPPPLLPVAAASAPAAKPETSAPVASPQRTAGWALLGAGGAGLVFGAIAGGMVLREKGIFDSHCSAGGACRDQAGVDAANRGVTWGTTSNVAFAAGAVVAAVGVILVLTSKPRSAPVAPAPAAPAATR